MILPTRRPRRGRRLPALLAAILLPLLVLVALVAPVGAAVIQQNSATNASPIALALAAPVTSVTGAAYVTVPPNGTPNGVSDAPLAGFGTGGKSFGILTTGNVNSVPKIGTVAQTDNGGTPIAARGNTAMDITVLRVDLSVPQAANCLTFDFKFLSEEFPHYVGNSFNDAFIAELDNSTWTTRDSAISAPDNFAFDSNGKVISINSLGLGGFSNAYGGNTTFNDSYGTNGGATRPLRASTQITPGDHALFFSIFDQGDRILDSAVFLDNLTVGFVADPGANCVPGARIASYKLALDPATGTDQAGTAHTVTATLTDTATGAPVANQAIAFTVAGANPTSGTGTTNGSGQATFTYTGTNPGTDQIAACYQPAGASACLAQASAQAVWTAAVTQTQLTVAPAAGAHGGTVTLAATLTTGGSPLAGQTVAFTLNGNPAGTATTGADGVATVTPPTSLGSLGAGSYPGAIGAAFAATPGYLASGGTGDLTVDPAPLTVTADNQTKTYGGTTPALSFSVRGLVNGDTAATAFTTQPTCTLAGTAITCAGGVAPNYTITYVAGMLTLTPAPLTVTADNQTKVLGAPNPAFTAGYSGLVNGDTASALGGTLTFATTATTTSGVGTYDIIPGGLTSANYAITFVKGTLTVQYASGGTCAGAAGHTVLQPVNADGTSVFKLGTTVPVKFRVCDASGASIDTPGVVTDFKLVRVVTGTTVSTPNEAGDSTTPDSAFRWDATARQWVFNLNTKALAAGSTYTYRIALNDGTSITFQFGLK